MHQYRMPSEWYPHRATWIAWPHEKSDWPGKFEPITWVYVEIVRCLVASEYVEIICRDQGQADQVTAALSMSGIAGGYRLHLLDTDRSWLRDSAPTAVLNQQGELAWVRWKFNAWAKYDNFSNDALVPELVARVSGAGLVDAQRSDTHSPLVLEGGAFDVDGEGTLLTTEECLLSAIQERNPGLTAQGYLDSLGQYLGVKKIIWLSTSCAGDDTHGHIDDVARFVAPAKVVLAVSGADDIENYHGSIENRRILQGALDASGKKLEIIELPMPRPIVFDGQRLPASYANFYIANRCVLVPTFNDVNDRQALEILAEAFPDRQVIGINCVDLVLGLGTLHCLTQQEIQA